MFVAFNFRNVWIRTTVNHNLIEDIKYFPWHCSTISKDFTAETHSESYINAIEGVITMDNLPYVLPKIFKL